MSTRAVIQYSDRYFHRQLKRAREYRGYKTQAAACRALRIPRQTWSLWEGGKRIPSLPQLILIANTLKLDLDFFFRDVSSPGDYDLKVE